MINVSFRATGGRPPGAVTTAGAAVAAGADVVTGALVGAGAEVAAWPAAGVAPVGFAAAPVVGAGGTGTACD